MVVADNTTGNLSKEQYDWFVGMIQHIKADSAMLDAGVASLETSKFYNSVFQGDLLEISKQTQKPLNHSIIQLMVIEFLKELINRGQDKIDLSFHMNGTSVLVWATINDDDEKAEADLFLSEAKINAKYGDYNYYVNTTIVEKSDCLSSPNHYVDFK